MRDWRHVQRISNIEESGNYPSLAEIARQTSPNEFQGLSHLYSELNDANRIVGIDVASHVERTPEVEAWLEETNRSLRQQLTDAAMYGTGQFITPEPFVD